MMRSSTISSYKHKDVQSAHPAVTRNTVSSESANLNQGNSDQGSVKGSSTTNHRRIPITDVYVMYVNIPTATEVMYNTYYTVQKTLLVSLLVYI